MYYKRIYVHYCCMLFSMNVFICLSNYTKILHQHMNNFSMISLDNQIIFDRFYGFEFFMNVISKEISVKIYTCILSNQIYHHQMFFNRTKMGLVKIMNIKYDIICNGTEGALMN